MSRDYSPPDERIADVLERIASALEHIVDKLDELSCSLPDIRDENGNVRVHVVHREGD